MVGSGELFLQRRACMQRGKGSGARDFGWLRPTPLARLPFEEVVE